MAGICPIGIIYFYKVRSPSPWIFSFFGFLAISDMESLLRDSLLAVLSRDHHLWRFSIGLKMVWWNLRSFPCELSCLINRSSWQSPILLSCCCFSTALVWNGLVGGFVSCSLVSTELKHSWRDWSALASNFLVRLLPVLFFCHLCNKEGFDSLIPFSLTVFLV